MDSGDAALAVEAALTPEEKRTILDQFQYGPLNGAHVADILDILADHDALLELREPFYENGYDQAVQAYLGRDIDPTILSMAVLAVALLAGQIPWTEVVADVAIRAMASSDNRQ